MLTRIQTSVPGTDQTGACWRRFRWKSSGSASTDGSGGIEGLNPVDGRWGILIEKTGDLAVHPQLDRLATRRGRQISQLSTAMSRFITAMPP